MSSTKPTVPPKYQKKQKFSHQDEGPSNVMENRPRSEVQSSPTPPPSTGTQVESSAVATRLEFPALPPRNEPEKSKTEAKKAKSSVTASKVLLPFIGLHISYSSRKELNSYIPCALMMDYIVHRVNFSLVDNFYFKRHAPDYHPYILRLYYGIVFWIQCLRAGHSVSALTHSHHQFLSRFLETFPPSSLLIAGPLIPLFKTLSSSQPEIPTYGKVYPRLPEHPGPQRRDAFFVNSVSWSVLPNIPGIFALLEHLNSIINAVQPIYPRKERHVPVTHDAIQQSVFGHHTYPLPANRTDAEAWSLVSSGLQYPCEADAKLNESFAERYSNFNFPITRPEDDLRPINNFMCMNDYFSWFTQVKNVATSAALYFEGSGSLADCDPTRWASNQIVVKYDPPRVLPTRPTANADKASTFPFAYRLSSCARGLPPLEEVMASMAQTNVHMFPTHPRLNGLNATTLQGEFWDIRPIELSPVNRSSYLAVNDIIKKMMKDKL